MSQKSGENKITKLVDTYRENYEVADENESWRKKLFAKTGMNKCPFSFLHK